MDWKEVRFRKEVKCKGCVEIEFHFFITKPLDILGLEEGGDNCMYCALLIAAYNSIFT